MNLIFWNNIILISIYLFYYIIYTTFKGFRHPSAQTVSRTSRVLTVLLGIVAKPMKRDKFEVTTDNVAYLTGETLKHTHYFM